MFYVDLSKPTDASQLFVNSSQENAELSQQEQLRRERMRLFVQGVSTYEWCTISSDDSADSSDKSKARARIMIPLGGKVYVHDTSGGHGLDDGKYDYCWCNCIANNSGNGLVQQTAYNGELGDAVDPHMAPNGRYVAFVVNDDLYYKEVKLSDGKSNHSMYINSC